MGGKKGNILTILRMYILVYILSILSVVIAFFCLLVRCFLFVDLTGLCDLPNQQFWIFTISCK